MRRLRLPLALLALVTLLMALPACGGDDAADVPVSFGEGEIPASFPDDFPIPPGAVVGATLVDRVRHRSEASLRIPLDFQSTVQYFNLALVAEGYVVDGSTGSAAEWTVDFSREELTGFINISGSTGAGTLAVITLNRA